MCHWAACLSSLGLSCPSELDSKAAVMRSARFVSDHNEQSEETSPSGAGGAAL